MIDMVTVEDMERRQRARWKHLISTLVAREAAEHTERGAQTVVAKRLGISSSTVSQGTSGGRGFGPKVQAAAAAWGLRPDYFTADGPDDLDFAPYMSGAGDDLRDLTRAVRELQAKVERLPDPDADTSRVRPKLAPPK